MAEGGRVPRAIPPVCNGIVPLSVFSERLSDSKTSILADDYFYRYICDRKTIDDNIPPCFHSPSVVNLDRHGSSLLIIPPTTMLHYHSLVVYSMCAL